MVKRTRYEVGDWVMTPEGITRIEMTGDAFASTEKNDVIFYDIDDDILPVPLTREILEKNGFDTAILANNEPECYYRDTYKGIDGCEEEAALDIILDYQSHINCWDLTAVNHDKGNDRIDMHIKYVHELQHALRLLGIDKDIEVPVPEPDKKERKSNRKARKSNKNKQ